MCFIFYLAVDSREAAEALVIGRKHYLIGAPCIHGNKVAVKGAFGVEIEDKDVVALGEDDNFILLMEPFIVGCEGRI